MSRITQDQIPEWINQVIKFGEEGSKYVLSRETPVTKEIVQLAKDLSLVDDCEIANKTELADCWDLGENGVKVKRRILRLTSNGNINNLCNNLSDNLPKELLESLIRGFVLLGRVQDKGLHGSVSPVRWLFRGYKDRFPVTLDYIYFFEWILKNIINPYEPFGDCIGLFKSYADFCHYNLVGENNIVVVQKLISDGVKDCGGVELREAICSGWDEIVKLLVSEGVTSDWGGRALLAAICSGWDEIVKLLVSEGLTDVNAKDCKHTVLGAAAKFGHIDIAKCLLENGAEVNAVLFKKTALDLVIKNPKMESLLKSYGAKKANELGVRLW